MLALDRAQRGSVQSLTFMSQYICHATSAGRKAGRLSTNTAQSVDRLSTNKAYLFFTLLKKLPASQAFTLSCSDLWTQPNQLINFVEHMFCKLLNFIEICNEPLYSIVEKMSVNVLQH